jgi:NAD(P)H-dependent FMN reductase
MTASSQSGAGQNTDPTPPKLLVIIGSTRPGRVGLPIGQWFAHTAQGHGGFDVHVADLATVGLPLLDEPNHPRLGDYQHEHTRRWSATVAAADAIVFVIPEYNHGYNAATKNAIDFLHAEWQHKAVGFVSYGGGSSGMRAVEQLKPVVAALNMVAAAEINISLFTHQVVDGKFAGDDTLAFGVTMMLDRLLSWTTALEPLRQSQ